MGSMSLRREMIFSGPIRDLPIGSKSSRDLWIVSNSSRTASRRSIRRLIVFGFLLGRGTAPGRLRFLGPKVGTLTAINGIYFWGAVVLLQSLALKNGSTNNSFRNGTASFFVAFGISSFRWDRFSLRLRRLDPYGR